MNQDPASLDRRYRDALLRFCTGYLGDAHAAEDAVQEVFQKALAAGSAPAPANERAWLYAVARNHCLNAVRGRKRRKDGAALASLTSDARLVASLTGPLTKLVKQEEIARFAACLGALAEPQREVLRLRYAEDLGREEIAEVLGLPVSVVKSRLHEGLVRLREAASRLP